MSFPPERPIPQSPTFRRRARALLVLAFSSISAWSCAPTVCTTADCPVPLELLLVDEQGAPVPTTLEFRSNQQSNTSTYECPSATCIDGIIHLEEPLFDRADLRYEVRFALADGDFTPWQTLELEAETVTFTDFGGDGCDCTKEQAFTPPLVVPEDARR